MMPGVKAKHKSMVISTSIVAGLRDHSTRAARKMPAAGKTAESTN
jgi:hypothetical protein